AGRAGRDVLSVEDRDGGDLDADVVAGAVQDHDAGVGHRGRPDDLPREELTCSPRVLGRDDRRELAAGDLTDDATAGWIDPADDAVRIDQIAGDVDVLEDFFDAHRLQR